MVFLLIIFTNITPVMLTNSAGYFVGIIVASVFIGAVIGGYFENRGLVTKDTMVI